jgi:hypothetical protein
MTTVIAKETGMSRLTAVIGSAPGSFNDAVKVAGTRALRTLLQGVAAAFVSAAPGSAILNSSYWQTFGFTCLAALFTAAASFLNNAATFLPDDPTQKKASSRAVPAH